MTIISVILICLSIAWLVLCSWANYMSCSPNYRIFMHFAKWGFAALACGLLLLFFSGCLSIDQSTRDRIDDVLAYIPTPSPTPTMTPTPVPTPVPTPLPNYADSFRGMKAFADAYQLTMIPTGRGNMLDLRGKDVEFYLSEWCKQNGGAAMPAFTDAETNGVFYQCR